MSTSSMDRLERLFQEAHQLAGEARRAYLDEACGEDLGLRAELEALLEASDEAEASSFMDVPLVEFAKPAVVEAGNDRRIGTHVGPYVVMERLGEGGMGNVYLAIRNEPFVRQVALKIVKRGMDTEDVLERFDMERQILASMDHPNIARLYDGGMTDDGLPYFAMEYVEGRPILAFCDENRLTIPQRLRLFQVVCQVVHKAHQSLILHRDLKPSNILVSADGEVKLLDFGIARLLAPDRTPLEGTESYNEFRLMTPEYASPEQVRGEPLTTASDVYALGVLLYVLVSGHRPYRLLRRTVEEVREVVCHIQPERPSTRVARVKPDSGGDAPTPAELSARRGTSVDGLRRKLRGDLDTIVLTALRKEPDQRYRSAQQLADDVGRFLSGRPVVARPPTLGYHMGKFVARHRTVVALATLATAALVAGLASAVWQATEAERARAHTEDALRRAEQALAQSEEVTSFLMGLFEASNPDHTRGDSISARDLLERGLMHIDELSGQPSVQARMQGVIGSVYQSLGRYDEAEALLKRSFESWKTVDDPAETANSLDRLALLYLDQRRLDEAEPLLLEALALREAREDDLQAGRASSLGHLAALAQLRGNYDGAESLLNEALELRRRREYADEVGTLSTLHALASVLSRRGAYDEAEALLRELLERERERHGAVHSRVAATLNELGMLLKERGSLAEAGAYYLESLEIHRKLYGSEHPAVAIALGNYAAYLHEQGADQESESLLHEALQILQRSRGPSHPDVAWVLTHLARLNGARGRFEDAASHYQEAIRVYRTALPAESPHLASTLVAYGEMLTARGEPARAFPMLEEGLRIRRAILGADSPLVHQAQQALDTCMQHLERASLKPSGGAARGRRS